MDLIKIRNLQKALKELQKQLKDQNTLFMYLTECQRYAVEEFVGQLPPYTKFNNFVYRISQMGLTAVENSHAKQVNGQKLP